MSTTKKLLIAGGDSWTDPDAQFYVNNGVKHVWPHYVAKNLNTELLNVGKRGMGNEYIHDTIIDAIEENIDRDIIVMVNWSAMNRTALWNYFFCDIRFNAAGDSLLGGDLNEWDYYEEICKEASNSVRNMLLSYIADNAYPDCTKESLWSAIANHNLRHIYLLDKYCRLHGIPILHHRALNIFAGIEWILSAEVNFQLRNRIIFDCRNNQYYKKIEEFKNVVGHPKLLKPGSSCFELYEKYFISKTEQHPTEKGHQLIASSFVDKYIELYS